MQLTIRTMLLVPFCLLAILTQSSNAGLTYSVTFTDTNGNNPFTTRTRTTFNDGSFTYTSQPGAMNPFSSSIDIFNLSAFFDPMGGSSEESASSGDFNIQVTLTDTTNPMAPGKLEILTEGFGTFGGTGIAPATFSVGPRKYQFASNGGQTETLTVAGQTYVFSLGGGYGVNNSSDPSLTSASQTVSLITSVPEPASFTLLGMGVGTLAVARLRRRKAA